MVEAGFVAGLCSVSLRSSSWQNVITAASAAGLSAIEWGADVHMPPGDETRARSAALIGRERAISAPSYGSYFRAGSSDARESAAILSTARALGSTRIRVWAGDAASTETSSAHRAAVVRSLQQLADLAALTGIEVGLEFHGGTLTDSTASTLTLLEEVDRPTVRTYWQPPVGVSTGSALAGLAALADHVTAVHVFSWWPGTHRVALEERQDLWRGAFDILATKRRPLDAFLEFFPHDDPSLLEREAHQLLTWISDYA